MLLLKMAFRNLWRRRFRTGITLFAIGSSFALLLFFVGLTEGSHELMIDLAIRMQAGHVIVQAPEFQKERALELRVTHPEKVLERIGPLPEGWVVTQRIFTTGLLRSADGSVMLDNLMAVDLENEKKISDVPRKIVRGAWLTSGEPGILIGEKAARLLKVDVGDKVVLSCSGLSQKVEERFVVAGVFRIGGDSDRGTAMIGLARGQVLLGMGGAISQLAFFMPSETSRDAARMLSAKLADLPVAVLHWEEALPVLTQLLWVDDVSMQVFIFIILGIVAAGIMNTVLMSVMERTRELGILKSLGMRPSSIFRLIMTESTMLGLLAVVVGAAVGLPLVYYFARVGIDPMALTGGEVMEMEGIAFTDRIHPVLRWGSGLTLSGIIIVMTVLSALWPAFRAMRILPVKALRQM
ncbi:FtsX-like permease family protein [Myxococcota bacterium]|nr:FtsX-like permease family protein [Myxococcota bacterium]